MDRCDDPKCLMCAEDDDPRFIVCHHPLEERINVDLGSQGYLGVETGLREMCVGCGWDFGPAKPAFRVALPAR